MDDQLHIFDSLPVDNQPVVRLSTIKEPVWTRNKARLIERYLNLFVMVTHHGVYIDGFAGPQRENEDKAWAAKLVLESKPPRLRNFFFVDANRSCVASLEKLKAEQPSISGRTIDVWHGDFNYLVGKFWRHRRLGRKPLLSVYSISAHSNVIGKLLDKFLDIKLDIK